MSTLTERLNARSWLMDLSDALNGFPVWRNLRPVTENHVIKLEEEAKDGHYLVRAELPGIDPAKDVDVTLCDNQLTIKAERSEKKESDGRSEFIYGSFIRTISLPAGADADGVKASYDKGILTVDVAIPAKVKHVAVHAASKTPNNSEK